MRKTKTTRAPFFALLAALLVFAAAAPAPAMAVEPDEVLDDPALEARARAISRELRCVVCQSQSIDDSNAPLAKDMRLLVRERLVAGDTDEEVFDFLVARYGDYVLLNPRLGGDTIFLWIAPLVVFLIAGGAAAAYIRTMHNRAQARDKAAITSGDASQRADDAAS